MFYIVGVGRFLVLIHDGRDFRCMPELRELKVEKALSYISLRVLLRYELSEDLHYIVIVTILFVVHTETLYSVPCAKQNVR